jgi:hypothetical protein
VKVVGAVFEKRASLYSKPPLVRWLLDLRTKDGEVLRAKIMLPTLGYEHARQTFHAVFPDVRWAASLATMDGWRRRGLLPLDGRKFDLVANGGGVKWIRAVGSAR